MKEELKNIPGYEGLYSMTRSGRMYSHKSNKFLTRCNDEYGFHIVKLVKNGEPKNHNVYDLWKSIFNDSVESEFKGAIKVKYGKSGVLLGEEVKF